MRSEVSLSEACSLIVDCPHKTAPESDPAYGYAVGTKAVLDGRILVSRARPVDAATYTKWIERATPRPGDIILCREAPVGPVAMVPETPPVCLGQRTVLLRADPEVANARFLAYALLAPDSQARLRQLAEGSTVPHLNVAAIRGFSVSLPSMEDQARVACVLGALDDKIDSNHRLAGVLEETAATLFRARFVDFVGAEEFEESEIGPVPKGWNVVALSSVFELLGGGTPATDIPEYWGGGIPWISVKDTVPGPYVIDTERTVTGLALRERRLRRYAADTVVITARGTVGNVALMAEPMTVNQSCYAIRGHDGVGQFYIYFLLRQVVSALRARSHGSVFSTITRSTFDSIRIASPPPDLLDSYEQAVRPVFDSLLGLERESRTLASLRDALLPKLISGQIRVSDTAEAIKPPIA